MFVRKFLTKSKCSAYVNWDALSVHDIKVRTETCVRTGLKFKTDTENEANSHSISKVSQRVHLRNIDYRFVHVFPALHSIFIMFCLLHIVKSYSWNLKQQHDVWRSSEEWRRNGGKRAKKFSSYIFKNRVTLFLPAEISCVSVQRGHIVASQSMKWKYEKGELSEAISFLFPWIFFAELPAFFNIGGGRKVCEQYFSTWMDSLEFFVNTGMGTFVFAGDWRIKGECFGPTCGKWRLLFRCVRVQDFCVV